MTASDISQRALGPGRRRGRAPRSARRVPSRRRERTRCVRTRRVRPRVGAVRVDSRAHPTAAVCATCCDAVAPGGTLLVVGHDLEPMRAPIDTLAHSRAFDPDAYVRVDDFAAALADSPAWDIELHEKRPRPAGRRLGRAPRRRHRAARPTPPRLSRSHAGPSSLGAVISRRRRDQRCGCRCWFSRAAWRVWWSRSARLGALSAALAYRWAASSRSPFFSWR